MALAMSTSNSNVHGHADHACDIGISVVMVFTSVVVSFALGRIPFVGPLAGFGFYAGLMRMFAIHVPLDTSWKLIHATDV